MININKVLILAVLIVALVAVSGAASAAVTFKVDKIQTNGVYHGIPKVASGETAQYEYEYTLIPDGTFTAFGHVTNDGDSVVRVGVDVGMHWDLPGQFKDFYVPAADGSKPGVANFAIKGPASSVDAFKVWVTIWTGDDPNTQFMPFDLTGVEYVDAPQSVHTIDQGPMSDATAIFANGAITYNGKPAYTIGYGA